MFIFSDSVIIEALKILGPIFAAIISLVQTYIIVRAKKVVSDLEKNTNSIKDALVEVTGKAKFAEGRLSMDEEVRQKAKDKKTKEGDVNIDID